MDFIKSAVTHTGSNLFFNSILLYTLTSDKRVLLFIGGLIINFIIFKIIQKRDDNLSSFNIQTIVFLTIYITSLQIFISKNININPFFYILIILLIFVIISSDNESFISISMGSFLGFCIGLLYAWLIQNIAKSGDNKNIQMTGSHNNKYSDCKIITKKDLPINKINMKEQQDFNCI